MMIHVLRVERVPDGVFGRMLVPGHEVLWTVEDDWKDNEPGESCIPAGQYRLERSFYHKKGYEAFEICDVPGRERILIHKANTEEDVKGCIGLGTRLGPIRVEKDEDTGKKNVVKKGVVSSAIAFQKFMTWMEHYDEAEILIEWEDGLP